MKPLRVGHLFAGAGGGILASEILGHESLLAVEVNEKRCRMLKESGWFPDMHVECRDIRDFDPAPWQGRLDCIAAGFPCQDISCAGAGHGLRGGRSGLVWPMLDAIKAIRPSIVFLENSPTIRTRGRGVLIQALLEMGYAWRDGTLAASDVGAGQKRNRWWCMAADLHGVCKLQQERRIACKRGWISNGPATVAGIDEKRCDRRARRTRSRGRNEFADSLIQAAEIGGLSQQDTDAIAVAAGYTGRWNWSPPHIGVRRVVDGVASRMDRISACGDGQVPLQAAVAWALLGWDVEL